MRDSALLGWGMIIAIFALTLGLLIGKEIGKKAALDELMRKPISSEPYVQHANA